MADDVENPDSEPTQVSGQPPAVPPQQPPPPTQVSDQPPAVPPQQPPPPTQVSPPPPQQPPPPTQVSPQPAPAPQAPAQQWPPQQPPVQPVVYVPPQYPGWYPPGYPVEPRPQNGMGVAAMVFGVISVVPCFYFVPLLGYAFFVAPVLAIIFGLVGRSQADKGIATNKPVATWGMWLGVAGLVMYVIGIVALLLIFSSG